MRIVLCYQTMAHHLDQIRQVVPDTDVIDAGQAGIGEEIVSADIFCGHAKVPVPWDQVANQGRLKWIQSSAAGLDHCLVPPVIDSKIVVTGASGLFADQVAEHTLALLTGLFRRLPVFIRAAQKREFIRRPTDDLHRKTVVIVGFGGNGRRIAELLVPLKMRILATDMFPDADPKPPHVESILPAECLHDIAPQADIIILCVPLTDDTRGMIDGTVFNRLKTGAVLVNVARGPVVVETDLIAALEAGQLSGAALDVTEEEPLPESSRLWEFSNVIITPHVAAQSASRFDDVTDFFCENLQRYNAGMPLHNIVDKRLGFPVKSSRRY